MSFIEGGDWKRMKQMQLNKNIPSARWAFWALCYNKYCISSCPRSPLERVWGIRFSFLTGCLSELFSGFPMVEITTTRTKNTDNSPLIIFAGWWKETNPVLEMDELLLFIYFSERVKECQYLIMRALREWKQKGKKESFVNAEDSHLLSGFPLAWLCVQSSSPAVVSDSHLSCIYTPVHLQVPPLFSSSSGMLLHHPKRLPIYFYIHF